MSLDVEAARKLGLDMLASSELHAKDRQRLLEVALTEVERLRTERDALARRLRLAETVCALVGPVAGCCATDIRADGSDWRCHQCSACKLAAAHTAWKAGAAGGVGE